MKSLIKTLLIATLVFSLFRDDLARWIPALRSPSANLPVCEAYEPTVSHYSYEALATDAARNYYKRIEKEVYSQPEGEDYELCQFNIKDSSEMNQIALALKAFHDDHPEVFWLCTASDFAGTRFYICSLFSREELKEKKAALNEKVQDFLDSVPSGMTREELEKCTHDYLIRHCEYDYDALDENGDCNSDYKDSNVVGTAYGALVNGKAVCSGYSRAYQLLLNRLGVDCVCISGRSHSKENGPKVLGSITNHMWNCVKNGSLWLMTDVTWDDGGETEEYTYFNLIKEIMFMDHYSEAIDQTNYKYNRFFNLDLHGDTLFVPG